MIGVYRILDILLIVLFFWELITFNYPLKVKLYKVGHGSCVFLTDGKKAILLDCGSNMINSYLATKIIRDLRRNYLWKVDYVFVSHLHADHINGIFALSRKCKIKKIFYSSYSLFTSNLKRKFLNLSFAKKVRNDMHLNIGKWEIDVFAEHIKMANSENDSSLVIKVNGKWKGLFFAGDLEEEGIRNFLYFYKKKIKNIFSKISIIIAPHHGRTSLNQIRDYVRKKNIYIQASYREKRMFSHFIKLIFKERRDVEIKIVRKDIEILF
jgi:beta-lactamase superfamily II metal-dependent hydrolase